MLYLRATLELDPQEGLSLTSRRFDFKIPLHLGPTGALRLPLQQFSQHIERYFTNQIDKNSAVKEYEILSTITGSDKLAVNSCTKSTSTSIPTNSSGISLSHAETATGSGGRRTREEQAADGLEEDIPKAVPDGGLPAADPEAEIDEDSGAIRSHETDNPEPGPATQDRRSR